MSPHVGPAGACAVRGADDLADPVILETCGEHVSCAVALRVGDQHNGSVILLPDLIALLHRRERETLGKDRRRLNRLLY
jgi:hypothetical protein